MACGSGLALSAAKVGLEARQSQAATTVSRRMFSHRVWAFRICAGLIWEDNDTNCHPWLGQSKKDGWAMSSLGPRPRPPLPVARLWLGAPPRTRAACHFFLSVEHARAHRPAPSSRPSLGVGDTDRACSPLVSSLSKVPAPSLLGTLSRLVIVFACCSVNLFSCADSDIPARSSRCSGASSMTDASLTVLLRGSVPSKKKRI